ncbi:MAG: MFS transporter [Coriobacteriia bacterium]|nr:MFS transporter [Coriobacteriia bacterium]
MMATCYTIFVNCIPLFQAHVVKDLGISMGQFNTGVSLCTVVAIFASLAFGALVDKRSTRMLGSVTVIITAAVLLLFSFITELWQLYALCVAAGMIVVAGTRLLVSVLTSNWFNIRRGLAVSIALSGSGFGGVILSPVTSLMIETYGWRAAFLLLAVISLVAALPLILLTWRNRPSDKGLLPYGSNAPEQALAQVLKERETKMSGAPVTIAIGWKVLRKNLGFWILIFGLVCMGIVNGAIITNSVSNMTSVTLNDVEIVTGGHSTLWAGNVWALYLGVVIVAKIALGAIYDRWGLRAGTLIGTAACIIACIGLCFPATLWGPILGAVAFGFGTCMGTVTPPVMVVKEYGKKDLGLVVGIATAFELFGAAIGAVVSGVFFDAFHSFAPAWIMALIASVIMGLMLLLSIPAAQKLVEQRKAQGAPELDEEGLEIAS